MIDVISVIKFYVYLIMFTAQAEYAKLFDLAVIPIKDGGIVFVVCLCHEIVMTGEMRLLDSGKFCQKGALIFTGVTQKNVFFKKLMNG